MASKLLNETPKEALKLEFGCEATEDMLDAQDDPLVLEWCHIYLDVILPNRGGDISDKPVEWLDIMLIGDRVIEEKRKEIERDRKR